MPNGLEIIGQGLRQTAGDLGSFAERQRQFQEMVERRRLALQEQARQAAEAERQAAEETRKTAEFEQRKHAADLEQQEKDRSQKAMADFRKFQQGEQKAKPQEAPMPYLAPGMGPEGEATYQPPQEYETIKPTRDQMQQKAMELGVYGDPGVKAYMDDTNPSKTLEGQKELFGIKDASQATREEKKQQYAMALEQYKQGQMDYRTLMTVKAAAEKAANPSEKDLQPAEIDKLTALGNKRDNVHYIADNFKDSFTGPGTWTQNKIGRIVGTNEDQVLWWQGYSAFVNEIRNSTFGASLTPGEKTEFEKTTVTESMNPEVAKKNLARQKQIVDNAVARQRKVHIAGRRVNNAQVDAALGGVSDSGAPPSSGRDPALQGAVDQSVGGIQEWVRDPGTGKLRPK